jgi:type I restriction enzyme M protein
MKEKESKIEELNVSLVEDQLDILYPKKDFIRYRQDAYKDNDTLKELMQESSKRGSDSLGKPEYIIIPKGENPNKILIVIESKASNSDHESDKFSYRNYVNIAKYAADGVKHYMKFLRKKFNVVGLATSGQIEKDFKLSTFLQFENRDEIIEIKQFDKMKSFEIYNDQFAEEKIHVSEIDLKKIAEQLNQYMYSGMNLSVEFRPPFISSAIIALMDKNFRNEDYSQYKNSKDLMDRLLTSVKSILKNTLGFSEEEISTISNTHGFKGEMCFNQLIEPVDPQKDPLIYVLTTLREKVMGIYDSNQNLDVIGIFYTEFLSYVNGDKGELGIVLTPKHVTILMTELLDLQKGDKIIDTCTGSGGFLLPVINKLKLLVGNDKNDIKDIEENSIMATELQNKMYSLLISNLAMRKIHTKNIKYGDAFAYEAEYRNFKANKAIVNPPYAMHKKGGKHELEFVQYSLDILTHGGIGVFIIPKSSMFKMDNKTNTIRKKLLQTHKLEAVFSMNNELFYPTSTSTVICVFKAHTPHVDKEGKAKQKTYMADWTNDGYELRKGLGRININRTLENDSKEWIKNYLEKNEIEGHSIYKKLELTDEWLYEAHGTISYLNFSFNDVKNSFQDLLAFEMGEK